MILYTIHRKISISLDNREAVDNLADSEVETGLDVGYSHIQNQEYFKYLNAMTAYCIPRL